MDGFGASVIPSNFGCHAASALGRSTLLTSKQLTLTAEKETQETQETLETQELQAEEKSESEEEKGSKDYTCCGVDLKPFLPVTLAVSTVIGGICVFILQVPTLCKFTSMSPAVLFWGFSVVYGVGSVLHALIRICYKLWL